MESKVRVIVRIRPFIGKEDPNIKCIKINRKTLLELYSPLQKACYKFDACYNQDSQQEEIFAEVSESINDVFKGLNTTIFAYGMTGAGKTHTMQGKDDNPGIIPRVAQQLMKRINNHSNTANIEISMSYLEIYNERVFDLLDFKEEDLSIRMDANHEIVIPGLSTTKVSCFNQFEKTYQTGCNNRTTAPTACNKESSRSHAILCLYVKQKQGNEIITGKIHLIDLAGSEDNRYTQNTGQRMTESNNINKSLFVLGNVVNALNDGTRVPYRESKLTRLLQDSLGGNSNAIMIANIAPCQSYFTETQRTLNFASKSRKIVNKPVVHAEVIQRTNDIDPAEERRKKLEEWKKTKKGKISKKTHHSHPIEKENISSQQTSLSNSSMTPEMESLLKRMSSLLGNDTDLEGRLLRIEKALQEKEQEEKQKIAKPLPLNISSTFETKQDLSLGLLTPSTKERTAKGFLLAGKEQEQRGQLTNALALYENAYKLLPNKNNRLAAKIKKLKTLTSNNSSSSSNSLKTSSDDNQLTDEQIIIKEKQILHLLNTGDVKELSELHMIAAKRAKLIITHRPFSSIKDLEKVHGVGKRFVEKFYTLNITGGET